MADDTHSIPGHEETTDMAKTSGFAGAFFPQCRNVRVMGGTFTSEVRIQQAIQNPRENFQWIGRGEIDIRREMDLGQQMVTAPRYHSSTGTTVRRMYTAKIRGQSEKSVILYEGANAEEECRRYISQHANLWHPNIMQIFGVANFCGKYAVIAQDSLIPHDEYLELHCPSVILGVYLFALWISEAYDVAEYLRHGLAVSGTDKPYWIRHSTGRLCVELEPSRTASTPMLNAYEPVQLAWNWHDSIEESQVLQVLSIPRFHDIVVNELANHRFVALNDQQTDIRIGAILSCPRATDRINELVEVAFLSNIGSNEILADTWRVDRVGEIMEDGWRRFNSEKLCGDGIQLRWWTDEERPVLLLARWISQANHIFKRLCIASDYEDYGFIDCLQITIGIAGPCVQELYPRYFFLCPLEHFSRGSNSFGLPEYPWFWSFDPTGKDRFTGEAAANHGFPAVTVDMVICLHSWDASVYDALRKFHIAKGFDPESQAVAIHLGYPLYQLTSEEEDAFAYFDEEISEPQILNQTGCEDNPEIGPTPLNASFTFPGEPVDTAASVEMQSDNKTSGLLNFLRNWETPQFGSLC
ncbi:hypothetical protein FB45DRAFT_890202 [Roridomyces roridus]|uniref:Protein kinase domain-containing protein n=1 Tax=Roridomyces roridus TaxID=1738132 RepID=A0AAD7G211_9AGAR|nr:hypothetical protein FB45DRAFT_890202 [Roridomyces roridus]